MLRHKSSAAIVAVSDIARAREFYEGKLRLSVFDDAMDDMVVTYTTGDTHLAVYQSEDAGTNRANAVVWAVGEDMEAIASDLMAQGVTFERYAIPDTTYENGVHRHGDFLMAWFKDPDGNILHLNSAN